MMVHQFNGSNCLSLMKQNIQAIQTLQEQLQRLEQLYTQSAPANIQTLDQLRRVIEFDRMLASFYDDGKDESKNATDGKDQSQDLGGDDNGLGDEQTQTGTAN